MDTDTLLKNIESIYRDCKKEDWDCHGAMAITAETYNHGLRFVNKLEKHGISFKNIRVVPMNDDNLSFKWEYDDNSSFSIDFNRSTDTLLWCCFKDTGHYWNGECAHLEDIIEPLKKYISLHEKKGN